ncbi:MAG: hypothetical protein ACREAM_00035, partial [Blastocatellia bacterium]
KQSNNFGNTKKQSNNFGNTKKQSNNFGNTNLNVIFAGKFLPSSQPAPIIRAVANQQEVKPNNN